jgi:hypothetical protein
MAADCMYAQGTTVGCPYTGMQHLPGALRSVATDSDAVHSGEFSTAKPGGSAVTDTSAYKK